MIEMADVLFGIKSDKFVQLVEEENGEIFIKENNFVFSELPTQKYIKDENGDVYVESKSTKSGYKMYYTLHSQEVYDKRVELKKDSLGHAIYKKI